MIGAGRAGTAFAAGLLRAGHDVIGPLGRDDEVPPRCDAALLCVPDSAIEGNVVRVPDGTLVAHCCGAHGVELLGGRAGFCLHPLMTLDGNPDALRGAWAAIDGTDPQAMAVAASMAKDLGLMTVGIASGDRAAYHAAAAIASNFLVTLEAAAERLAETAGLPKEALGPLVAQTVANWRSLGPQRALTGPVARGDLETVEMHRDAIAERAPDLLQLFDALRSATEQLASEEVPA